MQLRLLQQIAGSAGNTIVLGLPASATPLPVTGANDPQAKRPDVEPPELDA
jgi:hypothetical protein